MHYKVYYSAVHYKTHLKALYIVRSNSNLTATKLLPLSLSLCGEFCLAISWGFCSQFWRVNETTRWSRDRWGPPSPGGPPGPFPGGFVGGFFNDLCSSISSWLVPTLFWFLFLFGLFTSLDSLEGETAWLWKIFLPNPCHVFCYTFKGCMVEKTNEMIYNFIVYIIPASIVIGLI